MDTFCCCVWNQRTILYNGIISFTSLSHTSLSFIPSCVFHPWCLLPGGEGLCGGFCSLFTIESSRRSICIPFLSMFIYVSSPITHKTRSLPNPYSLDILENGTPGHEFLDISFFSHNSDEYDISPLIFLVPLHAFTLFALLVLSTPLHLSPSCNIPFLFVTFSLMS